MQTLCRTVPIWRFRIFFYSPLWKMRFSMRFNRRRAGAFIFLSIRTRGSFTVILQIPATGCQKSRWRCFYMLLLRPEPATRSAFPMSVTDWRSSIRKKMALRLSANRDMELILCSVSRQGGIIAELSDCYYYICNQIVFNTSSCQ